MMRAYLVLMFAIPLLDMFDRWFEKHATRIPWCAYVYREARWFDFGYYETGDRQWRRFFHLMLPSYDWIQIDYDRTWGWGQRVIVWTSARGFRLECWGSR